jgi:hypothetical protein
MKQVRFLVVAIIAVVMTLVVVGATSARSSVVAIAVGERSNNTRSADDPITPLTYAYVITGNVPVYATPSDAANGLAPVRNFGVGYLWVSLANTKPISNAGQWWYQINDAEYVSGNYLRIFKPSAFQGVTLDGTLRADHAFGWLVLAVKPSLTPGNVPSKTATLLPRYTPINVYEEQSIGSVKWYRIGDNQWVAARNVGLVIPAARPAGVGDNDKWIDVNLFEQTLAAYQGDRMVYATLVSSGLPGWSTKTGLFRIWTKVKQAKMSGYEGKPDYYFLEDVPWTMYFNEDYALHAAYWHDKFGFKHSHGCVNLPPKDAKWLFDWTTPTAGATNWTKSSDVDPGTWVWVH